MTLISTSSSKLGIPFLKTSTDLFIQTNSMSLFEDEIKSISNKFFVINYKEIQAEGTKVATRWINDLIFLISFIFCGVMGQLYFYFNILIQQDELIHGHRVTDFEEMEEWLKANVISSHILIFFSNLITILF